jgi:hypothetical protein
MIPMLSLLPVKRLKKIAKQGPNAVSNELPPSDASIIKSE